MTRATAAAALLAAALAACDSGGELAEETERRRAREAADSAALLAQADTGFQVPAFVDLPATAAAPPAGDTAQVTAPDAPPEGWTANLLEVRRGAERVETISSIRAGSQAPEGFDRVVIEFAGGRVPGHRLEYVDVPVTQCGSGEDRDVAGAAALFVRLPSTQAHDGLGAPTVTPRQRGYDFPVLREMELVCDFEGQVEIALGVAARRPFRTLELSNPARLVIDFLH